MKWDPGEATRSSRLARLKTSRERLVWLQIKAFMEIKKIYL